MVTWINDGVRLTIESDIYTITRKNLGLMTLGMLGAPGLTIFMLAQLGSENFKIIPFIIPGILVAIGCWIQLTDIVLDFTTCTLSVHTYLGSIYTFRKKTIRSFKDGIYFYIHIYVDEKYGNSYSLAARIENETISFFPLKDYDNGVEFIRLLQEAYPSLIFFDKNRTY